MYIRIYYYYYYYYGLEDLYTSVLLRDAQHRFLSLPLQGSEQQYYNVAFTAELCVYFDYI